ncbi:hypothetical protein ABIF69_004501 [Bradyrhizobium japonicum]
MTELFRLSPEVAGQLGSRTIMRPCADPNAVPEVERLEYVFDGWLGDDLIESFPCFIATERLASALAGEKLTGLRLEEAQVGKSEQFRELYPRRKLPPFKWLLPLGQVRLVKSAFRQWSGEDLCLAQRAELVVSERALAVLRKFQIDNCDIETLADKTG